MATTYEAIATVTVGSGGAASIDFTSIPATYTDLLVKLSLRYSGNGDSRVYFNFNGAGLNATSRLLYGFGSSGVGSTSYSTGVAVFGLCGSTETANTFANNEVYIPNYISASTYKSFSSDGTNETNNTINAMGLMAGLWSNNSAISSIAITPPSGTFVQYSTATLYGIKNS
jgi:hypothetical protein